MNKNQLTTRKSTALILGKSKSLLGVTKKLLEGKSSGLVNAKRDDISIIGDLMWEKESRMMNWYEATEYAKNLRLGGYDDWRLASKEELGDIVTLCGVELAVHDEDGWNDIWDKNQKNKAYQDCYKEKGFTSGFYWSSTDYANTINEALYVVFYYGYQGYDNKQFSYYVRCVRNGQ
ncbi:MAG: hypothetical protein COA92_00330 [Sulfurovum sp.]|nr:MAG: hypothetical protein COA92_00330 [Sulfurovum sp.]